MARPRIRTLKPENWQDEAVGAVSREARLLRDVLITTADDDGRWRHLPSAIIGFGYPYDDVAPAKIKRWSAELEAVGLIVIYDVDGKTYGCFPRWHLHQTINKYQPSDLPSSGDPRVVGRDTAARLKRGELPSRSGSTTGELQEEDNPHAQPRVGSVPFPSDPVDARAIVDDHHLAVVVEILKTAPRLYVDLELIGVANVLAAYPAADHLQAARIAVANSSDPNYRTTDAAKALRYAIGDLQRQERQERPRGGRGPVKAARTPKPWDGELADLVNRPEAA